MAFSGRSDFVDFIVPLGERMKYYDTTKSPNDQPKNDAADPARAIPQGFIDAMKVREAVFVEEQGVPLENEFDEDDARSFHWVAYASMPRKQSSPGAHAQDEKIEKKRHESTSTKMPIGTIRLVPPPQPLHPNGEAETEVHKDNEAYAKLGRLAVLKEFRKIGISKLLIESALAFARARPNELTSHFNAAKLEEMNRNGISLDFQGLVLVHAQVGVQKVWNKYGFETDQSMGTWDEEGIDHVGMWKRLDLTEATRRNSKIALPTVTSPY